MYKKNTAVVGFGIGHFINTTTGAAVTTGTPTCKRTLDGTGGACANAAAYNADGAVWEIDLDAADMNGDAVILSFTLADCLPISYTIKTVTKLASDLKDQEMRGTDSAALASVCTDERLARLDAAISTRSTYAGGAVASVTGNVGGNVAGSVASVTAPITVGNPNDCKADLTTLESRLSVARAGYLDKLNVSGVLAHSDAAATYKATGFSTLTAQQVWEYVTRELTSAGAGGATAQEVWEYATRSLTDKAGFTLHADYDAAKTAAPSVSEIQLGLATTIDVASVNYKVLEVLVAIAALNDLDLESVQDAISWVWAAETRTLTQTVGDATAANQADIISSLGWIVAVTEGDSYIDTTVTPWQMVVHKKGDPATEYIRKDLKSVTGEAITSISTVIGQQTEPGD